MKSKATCTIKSMLEDGWKRTTINGVRCLKFVLDNGNTLLTTADPKTDFFYPWELLDIVKKLGKPYKIMTDASRYTATTRRRREARLLGVDANGYVILGIETPIPISYNVILALEYGEI